MLSIIKKYKIVIGIIISILFLYIALRKISWADVGTVAASTDPVLIFWIVLINVIARVAVVIRWQLLLSNDKGINFSSAFHYLNIGYLINNILPARSGDFIKSVLLAKKNKIGKTFCLASTAVERLFDMLGLGMTFFASLIVLNLPTYIKNGSILIIIVAIFMFIMLAIFSKHSENIYQRFSSLSEHSTFLWILRKIKLLLSYSLILRNTKIIVGALITTAITWFLYVYTGYIIMEQIAPGPFSWHVSLLSLLIISVSFVLPTTPGNIGVYQFACVLAFSIAEMPREQAIVFSLLSQLPVYFLSIFLGVYSMWHEGIKKENLMSETAERVT